MDERGFTIVEVVVAAVILVVGVLALVSLVDAANGATSSHMRREAATNVARELIENAGAISYDDVTPDRLVPALQARGLSDSSADPGYTLARRGITFNVAMEACSLDDPHDGIGVHTAADGVPFCAGSPPDPAPGAPNIDGKPADYRRATATLTWTDRGTARTVRQSSFVMPPAGSDLPVVTSLIPSRTSPVTTNVPSVDFTATTSSVPAAVSWSQNGGEQGDATGSGTSWNFTWPIANLVDGDYVIGARARTGGGSYGPSTALTFRLNRFLPDAPRNFVAGKNASTAGGVDTEWLANREHDIVGYRVYRQVAGAAAPEQVNCGTAAAPVFLTASTKCTDAQPPSYGNGIDFVSSSQGSTETRYLTLNRPANTFPGDVMIMTVDAGSDGTAVTGPGAGWTQVPNTFTTGAQGTASASTADGTVAAVYYRVATGSEPPSYSFDGAKTRSMSGNITVWRDVNTASPIDAAVTGTANSCGANGCGSVNIPTVGTTTANDEVIRVVGQRNATTGTLTSDTPLGTTARGTANSASTLNKQSSLNQATIGPTTNAVARCAASAGLCGEWVANTIALKPAQQLPVYYWVKAVDNDPVTGGYREGPPSTPNASTNPPGVDAFVTNHDPTAPSGLSGTPAADGSNLVNWTTQGTDPDAGDRVAFYRVYRDGQRYDRTALGTDTSWTDARPGSGSHSYYLKAVDSHLAESNASQSVTVTQP